MLEQGAVANPLNVRLNGVGQPTQVDSQDGRMDELGLGLGDGLRHG